MGGVLDSCVCKIDCCNKNKNILINNDKEESEEEEEEYDEEQQFQGMVKNDSKRTYALPSDIINMKVKANRIMEHNTNPWSIYDELEDIGVGTYGLVKKVCLKNNPDIIRAIKIISKERLLKGINFKKI